MEQGTRARPTWAVQLALLQEGLVNDQGGVAGQLEESTDQAVRSVVFVGDEFQMVHVLNCHLEAKRLQRMFLMSKDQVTQ